MLSDALLARICRRAEALTDELVSTRRDFHRHAEPGWLEYRTASLIARRLAELGYEVHVGREVLAADARMGLPPAAVMAAHLARAEAQGGDPDVLPRVAEGFTGVVGVLEGGRGPTVGLRFDIDALALQESRRSDHRPVVEGFASVNDGAMHACGHDGHAAIGLGVAALLAELRALPGITLPPGRVKLIFQPAEEGVRGAKAMVEAGVLSDVDVLLAGHLYSGWPLGQVRGGQSDFLATHKFDAIFTGAPAHAAADPQLGRNALLAAATATLNLHAIPRHAGGVTRINVGELHAGAGRNIICPEARLVIETRGATTALNAHVYELARRILWAAAEMHGCQVEIVAMGAAENARSDPALAARVEALARALGGFSPRGGEGGGSGSEDFTTMMNAVQARGGRATFLGLGARRLNVGHHTDTFDFDERALPLGVMLFVAAVMDS